MNNHPIEEFVVSVSQILGYSVIPLFPAETGGGVVIAPQVCPFCGETYEEFRTGLRYRDVYQLLWSYSDDRSTWRHKRRHSVLGHWREQKIRQFQEYHQGCQDVAS